MAAIDLGSVMGPQGPQGSIWYQGTAITGTSTTAAVFSDSGIEEARVYDKYFNTGTNDVYTCTVAGDADTAKWAWIGNLRGAQGNIGPVGPTGSVDMNTPIEFTEAETRANIESGESVSTIFGKLKKVVGDLLAGAASTLLGQKLTASRALVSDANGNVGVSGITSTELGYLDGVTGNIQEQIGNLSQLPTTDKSSLVAAISEQNVKNSVISIKDKITFLPSCVNDSGGFVAKYIPSINQVHLSGFIYIDASKFTVGTEVEIADIASDYCPSSQEYLHATFSGNNTCKLYLKNNKLYLVPISGIGNYINFGASWNI